VHAGPRRVAPHQASAGVLPVGGAACVGGVRVRVSTQAHAESRHTRLALASYRWGGQCVCGGVRVRVRVSTQAHAESRHARLALASYRWGGRRVCGPQACVACDAGFATLEVALGSAPPCPRVAL